MLQDSIYNSLNIEKEKFKSLKGSCFGKSITLKERFTVERVLFHNQLGTTPWIRLLERSKSTNLSCVLMNSGNELMLHEAKYNSFNIGKEKLASLKGSCFGKSIILKERSTLERLLFHNQLGTKPWIWLLERSREPNLSCLLMNSGNSVRLHDHKLRLSNWGKVRLLLSLSINKLTLDRWRPFKFLSWTNMPSFMELKLLLSK
ncbi:hypothetical protein J1N35_013097 [Gossypium stocksii]|uniref:Uncharacterized protein n=1 Tax=Gossypium stocksii TaxID=47602 RepID=A0A9D3VTA5_9ROSI|nr:hypothetical protein J1N35_013097 [Gossypium stocksii]